MKISKLLVVFMVITLLAGLAGCAGTSQEPTKANKTPNAPATDQLKDQLFVEAGWLKANLDEVIVLDVRKADVYAAGHIPGAISARPGRAWPIWKASLEIRDGVRYCLLISWLPNWAVWELTERRTSLPTGRLPAGAKMDG